MKLITLSLLCAATLCAGGLRLEVTSGKSNSLVAKVVACGTPGNSSITATLLLPDGTSRALTVKPTADTDTFTVEPPATMPASGTVQIQITDPDFAGYQPRYQVRIENGTAVPATMKQTGR